MLRLSMLRVRYYKRCVSMFLALSVLCCGNGGHAAGSAGVDVWTWVHRAFAPAAHHRVQQPLVAARVNAGVPGQFAVDGATAADEGAREGAQPRGLRLGLRRAQRSERARTEEGERGAAHFVLV